MLHPTVLSWRPEADVVAEIRANAANAEAAAAAAQAQAQAQATPSKESKRGIAGLSAGRSSAAAAAASSAAAAAAAESASAASAESKLYSTCALPPLTRSVDFTVIIPTVPTWLRMVEPER